jgi:Zn-dependent protease with chaperone function
MSNQPTTGASVTQGHLEILRAVAPPQPVSGSYRRLMALAALVLLLLPLAYLSLVATVGAAGWWWAMEGAALLPDRGAASRGAIYGVLRLGPCLLSLMVCLALLKPLFSRGRRGDPPQELKREDQPELFAYVERVAELLGAPKPHSIRVDLDINASASLTHGWRSLLSGDMTLTLGLPLVAGLDLRQFTGVLAHELGHFAQGGGLRSTFVIRSLEAWFQRVVFERDAFDHQLERLASNPGYLYTQAVLQAARGSIWLARRLLHGLMLVGALVSRALMRQMEFDADAQALRIAGSQAFASGMQALCLLDRANHAAGVDADLAMGDGKLPDDWSELVLLNRENMPAEVIRATLKPREQNRASYFASHPPTELRIARAEAANLPSGVEREGLARQLFADFSDLSRQLTRAHFKASLGPAFQQYKLHPARRLGRDVAQTLDRIDVLRRDFELLTKQPFLLPWSGEASTCAWTGLAALRSQEAAQRPAFSQALETIGASEAERRVRCLVALFEQGKIPVDRKRHGIAKGEPLQKPRLAEFVRAADQDLCRLKPYSQLLEGQLLAALSAVEAGQHSPSHANVELTPRQQPESLHTEQRASASENAVGTSKPGSDKLQTLLSAAQRAAETLRTLGTVSGQLGALRMSSDILEAAGPLLAENRKSKPASTALAETIKLQAEALQQLQATLTGPSYPYEHSEPGISLERAIFDGLNLQSASSDTLLTNAGTVYNKLIGLQARALADLFSLANWLESNNTGHASQQPGNAATSATTAA